MIHAEFNTIAYYRLPCCNISSYAVMLRIDKLSKESGSDQAGYVISSPILQDNYLQVTEQSLGSDNYLVKFTSPKQTKVY